jgi:hypothetical protein
MLSSIGFRSPVREIASIIRDFRDPEGSGGDARRTSYTLPPRVRFRVILRGFAGRRCFHYTVYYTESPGLGAPDGLVEVLVEQLRGCPSLLVHDMGIDVCRYVDPRMPEQFTRGLQWDALLRCVRLRI